MRLLRLLNDTVFPPRCPVCEQIVTPPGRGICAACLPRVSFVAEPRCL